MFGLRIKLNGSNKRLNGQGAIQARLAILNFYLAFGIR